MSTITTALASNGPERPSFADLPLTAEQRDILDGLRQQHRGLVVITGPTGSGKTVTATALAEHLATGDGAEKKVIYISTSPQAPVPGAIHVRVGIDIKGTDRAVLLARRLDPDVIVLDDVDLDGGAVNAVLDTTMTGHLVILVVTGSGALSIVERVRHALDDEHQPLLDQMLLVSTSQTLVGTSDGRAPEFEVIDHRATARDVVPTSRGAVQRGVAAPKRANATHRKRLARLLAEKTGVSYQSARRLVDEAAETGRLPRVLDDAGTERALAVLTDEQNTGSKPHDPAEPTESLADLTLTERLARFDAATWSEQPGTPLGVLRGGADGIGTVDDVFMLPRFDGERVAAQHLLIKGVCGSGKSVLAANIAFETLAKGGWVLVEDRYVFGADYAFGGDRVVLGVENWFDAPIPTNAPVLAIFEGLDTTSREDDLDRRDRAARSALVEWVRTARSRNSRIIVTNQRLDADLSSVIGVRASLLFGEITCADYRNEFAATWTGPGAPEVAFTPWYGLNQDKTKALGIDGEEIDRFRQRSRALSDADASSREVSQAEIAEELRHIGRMLRCSVTPKTAFQTVVETGGPCASQFEPGLAVLVAEGTLGAAIAACPFAAPWMVEAFKQAHYVGPAPDVLFERVADVLDPKAA